MSRFSTSTVLWLLFIDVAASILALILYGWDKAAAKRRGRRVSERTLHLIALLGGWPGAILAQALFRHKTQKRSFRRVFWATVAANLALTFAVLSLIKLNSRA